MSIAKVKYSELLPHEFRARLEKRPLAYLPLGTIEWHGEHCPLGADAMISEALMARCARSFGGIVMPPIHLGPDRSDLSDGQLLIGADTADSTKPHHQLDGSLYWVPEGFFVMMIDAILEQLKRAGFAAVFADGHGPSRWSWMHHREEREARFGLKLIGIGPELYGEWTSQMDHAALNETSLLMAVSDLVDLDQLDADRSVWPTGVSGEDPRDASVRHGEACLTTALGIVERLLTDAGMLEPEQDQ